MRRSNEPFAVVLIDDEAIEPDTLGKYLDGRDYASLRFKDGITPTVYWCRPLKTSEEDEVIEKGSEAAQYKAAFVRGLMRVTGLHYNDGSRRDWFRPDGLKVLPNEALDDYFDRVAVQEIGMVIRNHSFLGRTRGGYFPLPATSLLAMQAHKLRLVALTIASSVAAASSSPPEAHTPQPSQPTEPPAAAEPTKSSPGGDASGAATATG
jgi:hypothetical protein